jgi:hypothetical protein
VVTGHRNGAAVILDDAPLATYAFKAIPGFKHTYVWQTRDGAEREPARVDAELPRSALPPSGGSLVQIATFPPENERGGVTDPQAVAAEYAARLPGLADTFERDGSRMHVTETIDYALVLEGTIWLELDGGEAAQLYAGDVVVQQGTRHRWRNRGEQSATIAFFMLAADQ